MTTQIKEFAATLARHGIGKGDLPAIKMNLREFMLRDSLGASDLPLLDELMDAILASTEALVGEEVMDYLTKEVSRQF